MGELHKLALKMLERAASENRQEFGSFFLSRLLGFEVSYDVDVCIVSFDVSPPLLNPRGSLHGGIIAAALDTAMGHLLNHVSGPGATLEMKVQYLAPVIAGRVTCRAHFLRRGQRVSFLQAEAIGEDGEIVAYATATWKLLATRKG